jgi:hypothetical protein
LFLGRAKFHLSRSLPVFWDSRLGTTDEHRWARIIGDLLAVVWMEPRKTRITRNERVFVFGEGEVPSEPQHFCVSRFAFGEPRINTDRHGFGGRGCGWDHGRRGRRARVLFFGRAKFHLSRSLPVFWDSRFSTTDKHRWARIIGDLLAVVDGTTKDTEDTEGERVLFGGAKFHVSRRIPVFRDSRFFNHG